MLFRSLPLDEARGLGAMALFGEKYGDRVRVVEIGGPWSLELCAGTHVGRTSQIGLIDLVAESSVGSTNRRIEALVGGEAFDSLRNERTIVSQLSTMLKTPKDQLPDRIAELVANLKAAERRVAQAEAGRLAQRVPEIAATASPVGAVQLVAQHLGELGSADDLRSLVTAVRERLAAQAAVVALTAEVGGKPTVIVATTPAARDAGAKAGALVRAASAVLGGGGGGKDDLAQGGGTDVGAVSRALTAIADGLR